MLGKKRRDSYKVLAGHWHVPGETVEEGETDESALIRGVKEETGLDITVGRYIGCSITPTSHKQARWYECFATSDKAIPGSDLEEVRWVFRNSVLTECGQKSIEWPDDIKDYFS